MGTTEDLLSEVVRVTHRGTMLQEKLHGVWNFLGSNLSWATYKLNDFV